MSADAPGTSTRSRSRSGGAICFERATDDGRERVRLSNRADASDADSITVSEPDARDYGDELPPLPVPASGERRPDCGDDIPALFCGSCGSPSIVGRTCRRSRCPRCWQAWDFQRAKVAAGKVEGLRRYRAASGNPKAKYHHLTVSFPDSARFNSDDALSRAFDATKLLLGESGVYDGYIIYHPWRIAEAYRGDVRGHESGDGDMTWADVLTKIESDEWTWEAAREELLVYAPHFHVFANAEFVQGGAVTEAVEEQSGVVIHRITKGADSSVSLYDPSDLCAAVAYAYSHAGLTRADDGSHRVAARAFGQTANFDPTPNVEHGIDRELREVAPDVLGVAFPKPKCDNRTLDAERESADYADSGAQTPAEARSADANPGLGAGRSGRRDDAPAGGAPAASPPLSPAGSNIRSTGGFATGSGVALDPPTGSSGDSSGGGTATTWNATAGVSPDYLNDPTDDATSRCGGNLVPMWAADDYLNDSGWMKMIGREAADELRSAYDEWKRRGRPEPDAPPPDVPPPD